jgi:FhaA, N-terminal domain/FHA domain
MAGPFAALERFFERLFERPAVMLFRPRLQPVQLQRRLERAMDGEQRHGADRTYVPNRYRVSLNPEDLTGFRTYQHSLEEELAEMLLARAHQRGYTLLERPRVTLHEEPSVGRGDVSVDADVLDPLMARPAPAGFRRVSDEESAGSGLGSDGDGPRREQTAVFEVPRPAPPRVSIVVRSPGRAAERMTLTGGNVRIGRAGDNDIVLEDERVSRYHGQLLARQGGLVFSDLGSTNGSYVGGSAVSEIALGAGDILQLGDSTLTVEADA